jgi:hypothetical protein
MYQEILGTGAELLSGATRFGVMNFLGVGTCHIEGILKRVHFFLRNMRFAVFSVLPRASIIKRF